MSMYQNSYDDQNYGRTSDSHLLSTTLSMLGGAAVGAALMYLFDPEQGEKRRTVVGGYTGDALKGTGGTLSMAASQLAEKAKELSQSLASGITTGAGAAAAGASSAAAGAYNSAADRTASMFGRQRQTNDEWLGDVESKDHSMTAPVAGLSAVGGTLLAVGALYLLDPEKRRMLMRSVNEVVRSTGQTFHSLGQQFGRGGGQGQQQSGHMDYATSDDYVDYTSASDPEVGRSTQAGDVPPQGT